MTDPCPKCNASGGVPCAYPDFNFRDCPMRSGVDIQGLLLNLDRIAETTDPEASIAEVSARGIRQLLAASSIGTPDADGHDPIVAAYLEKEDRNCEDIDRDLNRPIMALRSAIAAPSPDCLAGVKLRNSDDSSPAYLMARAAERRRALFSIGTPYDQTALDAASRELHMSLLREGSSYGTRACEEMGRVFMTAYLKAAPSALAWIPCSEREPDKDGTYFVMCEGDVPAEAQNCIRHNGEWRWHDGTIIRLERDPHPVKFWMPIPSVPSDGKANG